MPSHASASPPIIASYLDTRGRRRELLSRQGAHGSVLVIDRDATTLCDRRLVAHLAPDEPRENVALVCRLYLRDARRRPRRCRAVVPEDLRRSPVEEPDGERSAGERNESLDGGCRDGQRVEREESLDGGCRDGQRVERPTPAPELLERDGLLYRIGPCRQRGSTVAQLRWSHRALCGEERPWQPLSLREVVERFERYEPMCSLSAQAIAEHACRRGVSVAALRAELARLRCSAVVLNHGLREAVMRALARDLSMSEIAMRCGMVKRDRHGRRSGETSWLARRVGLMPDGGRPPARWIHSDVLALIAREGLGVSPREVEVDV
jgi:hypothetical protein